MAYFSGAMLLSGRVFSGAFAVSFRECKVDGLLLSLPAGDRSGGPPTCMLCARV